MRSVLGLRDLAWAVENEARCLIRMRNIPNTQQKDNEVRSGFVGSGTKIARRLRKAAKAMSHSTTRRALRYRVAPTYEHEKLLRGLGRLETIIDVGANSGQFTLLSRLVHPSAKIIAFEPMVDAAERFEKIFSGDSRVTLHRVALGAECADSEIHLSAKRDSSSLMPQAAQADYFPQTKEIGTEKIQVAPLSTCVTENDLVGPVLMKIDVQGFEGDVLRGSADLLKQIDWVYCEASFVELYQDQPLAGDIIAFLATNNFALASVVVDDFMVFDGRAVQADFLFQRR